MFRIDFLGVGPGAQPNTTTAQYTITNTANLTIKPFVVTNVRTSAANAVIGDYVTHTISVVGERADASYLSNVVVEAVT